MKKDWKHLEKFRMQGKFSSPPGAHYGHFQIPHSGRGLIIICSSGEVAMSQGLEAWDHVSVRGHDPVFRRDFIPSWPAMCYVKELFWDDDECVVQYHPPKSDHINVNEYVLHLWRNPKVEFPMPPKDFV